MSFLVVLGGPSFRGVHTVLRKRLSLEAGGSRASSVSQRTSSNRSAPDLRSRSQEAVSARPDHWGLAKPSPQCPAQSPPLHRRRKPAPHQAPAAPPQRPPFERRLRPAKRVRSLPWSSKRPQNTTRHIHVCRASPPLFRVRLSPTTARHPGCRRVYYRLLLSHQGTTPI